MNSIKLFKPIILCKSLNDMTAKQRERAIRLLHNQEYLTVDECGMAFSSFQKDIPLPPVYFYGSEAVCIYRQMLGLPDVSIRSIDINEIMESAPCFDILFDLLFFLHNIEMRNNRIKKLDAIDAPSIILHNEYRLLYETVEFLQDNNWCGHPKVNRYNTAEEGHEPEYEEEVRHSLADIGYDLTADCIYDPEKDKM
jgi:hypothetical protein